MKDEPFEIIIAGGGGLSHDGGVQRAPILMSEVVGLVAALNSLDQREAEHHRLVSIVIYWLCGLIALIGVTLVIMGLVG